MWSMNDHSAWLTQINKVLQFYLIIEHETRELFDPADISFIFIAK